MQVMTAKDAGINSDLLLANMIQMELDSVMNSIRNKSKYYPELGEMYSKIFEMISKSNGRAITFTSSDPNGIVTPELIEKYPDALAGLLNDLKSLGYKHYCYKPYNSSTITHHSIKW